MNGYVLETREGKQTRFESWCA